MLERPFKAKVGLRGGADVARAVEPVLGFPLPKSVGQTGSGSGAHAFWIGPDDCAPELAKELFHQSHH